MKKNNTPPTYPYRLLAVLVASLTILVSGVGIVSLNLASYLEYALPLALGVVVYMMFMGAHKLQEDSFATLSLKRLLAALICILIPATLWFSIQSLWVDPFDPAVNRFVLENIATGTILAAGAFTLLLTALQRDLYWPTSRKPNSLDEREMKDRQEVFERSYKFGAGLAFLSTWGYLSTVDSLDWIKEIGRSPDVVPGHYFFPAYCLVIAVFSLPMIVAAWKKR